MLFVVTYALMLNTTFITALNTNNTNSITRNYGLSDEKVEELYDINIDFSNSMINIVLGYDFDRTESYIDSWMKNTVNLKENLENFKEYLKGLLSKEFGLKFDIKFSFKRVDTRNIYNVNINNKFLKYEDLDIRFGGDEQVAEHSIDPFIYLLENTVNAKEIRCDYLYCAFQSDKELFWFKRIPTNKLNDLFKYVKPSHVYLGDLYVQEVNDLFHNLSNLKHIKIDLN